MQFNPVYLYSNKIDVFTNPLDSWTTERYRRVYNRNLKIYRSVDNRIDIQVRNSDQKATNITGSVLVFNLVTREAKDLVLQKDMIAMDPLTGKVTVTLTEDELYNLDLGSYNYSIIKEVRENIDSTNYKVVSRIPMYVGSQYDVLGTLDILGDVLGTVEPSVVVDKFSYTNPFTTGDETPRFFISSIIDAKPTIYKGSSLHTFQFYQTNYQGSVMIQGSIDDQGATPSHWSDIVSVDVVNEPYKNIVGKWNWFRIKHIPQGSSNTASFVVSQKMSFDYAVSIYTYGSAYKVGDTILLKGNRLGGELVTNDLVITVTSVGTDGRILTISWEGRSYPGVKTFVLSGDASVVGTIDKVLYR